MKARVAIRPPPARGTSASDTAAQLKKVITAMKPWKLSLILILTVWGTSAVPAQVVNVYSARHYDTDDQIYQKFYQFHLKKLFHYFLQYFLLI